MYKGELRNHLFVLIFFITTRCISMKKLSAYTNDVFILHSFLNLYGYIDGINISDFVVFKTLKRYRTYSSKNICRIFVSTIARAETNSR